MLLEEPRSVSLSVRIYVGRLPDDKRDFKRSRRSNELSETKHVTWDRKCFLRKEKISCGHMQVSQKAGLKWQLAICPPMSWLFRTPAKRKMVTLAWAALFCTICNNRTLHAEWSQSFAQLMEGIGALISLYSVFTTWGLQESPFTLLSSLALCCHRMPKWYLKELNWALT